MADATVWSEMLTLARKACTYFQLPMVRRIEAIPYHPVTKLDGECDKPSRLIRVRPWRLGHPQRSFKESTLWAILSHELAHLSGGYYGCNHDEEHGELARQIADWFRGQGKPVARRLHAVSHCGTAAEAPYRKRVRRLGRHAWVDGRRRVARAAARRRRRFRG